MLSFVFNIVTQTTWLPDQVSTFAHEIDSLFYFVYSFTIAEVAAGEGQIADRLTRRLSGYHKGLSSGQQRRL